MALQIGVGNLGGVRTNSPPPVSCVLFPTNRPVGNGIELLPKEG